MTALVIPLVIHWQNICGACSLLRQFNFSWNEFSFVVTMPWLTSRASDVSQLLVATNTAVILLKSCKIEKSTWSKRDENMLIVLNACDANLKINTSFFPVWSHRTQIGCIYFHTKRECRHAAHSHTHANRCLCVHGFLHQSCGNYDTVACNRINWDPFFQQ